MVGGTIVLEGTNPLVRPLIEFYEQGLALDDPPPLYKAPGSIMDWMRDTICDRFRVDVILRDPEEPLESKFMPDSTNHINYLALYAVRFAFDHVSDVMMFKLTWL